MIQFFFQNFPVASCSISKKNSINAQFSSKATITKSRLENRFNQTAEKVSYDPFKCNFWYMEILYVEGITVKYRASVGEQNLEVTEHSGPYMLLNSARITPVT